MVDSARSDQPPTASSRGFLPKWLLPVLRWKSPSSTKHPPPHTRHNHDNFLDHHGHRHFHGRKKLRKKWRPSGGGPPLVTVPTPAPVTPGLVVCFSSCLDNQESGDSCKFGMLLMDGCHDL